jgi:hypothetical protein
MLDLKPTIYAIKNPTISSINQINEPAPIFNKITNDPNYDKLLEARWNEAIICANNGAYLASVTMLGGVLEGVLYSMALRYKEDVYRTKIGINKKIENISLNDLIMLAYELKWIPEYRKPFNEALRDFRNYIHPREQLKHEFNPDEHIVSVSIPIIKATIDDMSGYVNKKEGYKP